MKLQNQTVKMLLSICLLSILRTNTLAKSLYVITDRSSTVTAYKIEDEQITYQKKDKDLPDHGGGAA